ncbi:hypothetical protein ACFWAY_26345 [Rhodococcus sp. NPDC059968]|uniref:hypothetical protein n=1 Tax=Rhodococcus sp. NPDC059968 TaxID=3347017 RepID=UPI0036733046
MLVMTDANLGMEEEFNRFLDDVHIGDVLQADGLVSARRFRLSNHQPAFASGVPDLRYLTVYEIDCEDVRTAIASLERHRETGRWRQSDTTAPSRVCAVYEKLPSVWVGADADEMTSESTRQIVRPGEKARMDR